ncbi:MAG: polyamine aminopropyltransferase [Chloroflexi bacterium]|nr:polyamine aminopropyltransferase [Chloroflexota bacterium]
MHDLVFLERDPFSPIRYIYRVSGILYCGKSKYQEIQVFESPDFGKMLVLDGVVQLTERDEFFYHEMLAHVILHAHPNPRTVLIIGGGDGGTLREVLKHNSVERVQLVEIDRQVIETSKRFFHELAGGFSDPRVHVKCTDGTRYVRQARGPFDVVIVDSTDPVGYGKRLFIDQFFADILSILNETGMFVIQTESLHFHRKFVADVQIRLGRLFKIVELYCVSLATYPGNWWTFSIASTKYPVAAQNRKQEVITKYYDEEIHKKAFVPSSLRRKLLDCNLDW